jgi:hypothetical protein
MLLLFYKFNNQITCFLSSSADRHFWETSVFLWHKSILISGFLMFMVSVLGCAMDLQQLVLCLQGKVFFTYVFHVSIGWSSCIFMKIEMYLSWNHVQFFLLLSLKRNEEMLYLSLWWGIVHPTRKVNFYFLFGFISRILIKQSKISWIS